MLSRRILAWPLGSDPALIPPFLDLIVTPSYPDFADLPSRLSRRCNALFCAALVIYADVIHGTDPEDALTMSPLDFYTAFSTPAHADLVPA